MTNFIAVANQKGGVGKTTIAVHLAALAHETDQHTLLVDLDQQGSATFLASGRPGQHRTDKDTVLDLWDDRIKTAPIKESVFGFDYLQASHRLDMVDDDPRAAVQALMTLDDCGYDTIIIDCPPAPGVRQIAPLLIADRHIVPITADSLGTQGLVSTWQQHARQIRPQNTDIDFRIVINLHKLMSSTQKAVIEQLREKMGDYLVEPALTDREAVKHALRSGKPIWAYAKEPFAEDWRTVCESLLLSASEDEGTEVDEPENAQALLDAQEGVEA